MSDLSINYKVIIEGAPKRKVRNSARTWFVEANSCRVSEKNGVVRVTAKTQAKTLDKWCRHLVNKYNATVTIG